MSRSCFDYAQFLVPTSDLDSLAQGRAARLVRFLSWAQNPLIKRVNIAFVLVVDKLVELNERLVQSPHVATIEIPLPDEKEREQFVPAAAGGEISKFADFTTSQLAKVSNGLNAHEFKCGAYAGRTQWQAARRDDVSAAQEVDDRAAMPGIGRNHRTETHAGACRRTRCRQGTIAAGCEVDWRRPNWIRRRWAI